MDWPSSRFANPSLATLAPGIASSSLQNQGTNLLINIQSAPGQSLQGSNLLGQITFLAISTQPSAFVSLPVRVLSATKSTGAAYTYYAPAPGQVAVVNDLPLLQAASTTYPNLAITVYGRVGTTYQLQSSTNFSGTSFWTPVANYKQTTTAQVVNVSATAPVIFYRILQR
jgi:hypothetical protein